MQKKCSEWELNSRPLKCVDTLKLFEALHKKLGFLLRNSSINVTKSTISCGLGDIYWRNPSWKTSFFGQWRIRPWVHQVFATNCLHLHFCEREYDTGSTTSCKTFSKMVWVMVHQFGILYISLIIVNIVRYCFSSTLLWTLFNLYYVLSLPHQNKERLRMCSTNEVVKVSKFGYHKKTLRSIKIVFVVVVVVVFSGFFGFSCSLAPL